MHVHIRLKPPTGPLYGDWPCYRHYKDAGAGLRRCGQWVEAQVIFFLASWGSDLGQVKHTKIPLTHLTGFHNVKWRGRSDVAVCPYMLLLVVESGRRLYFSLAHLRKQ